MPQSYKIHCAMPRTEASLGFTCVTYYKINMAKLMRLTAPCSNFLYIQKFPMLSSSENLLREIFLIENTVCIHVRSKKPHSPPQFLFGLVA